MTCAICKGEIEVARCALGAWTEGHNAEPVVEGGRCCGNCNNSVVIPARLRDMVSDKAIRAKRVDPETR